MTIDTTTGIGRGNIYHACSPWANYSGRETNMFTRSTTGGQSWMTPIGVPLSPYWGTLEVGPNGELFVVGSDYDVNFTVCRSTNAQNPSVTPVFELTRTVSLGGESLFQVPGVNPAGLIGQPWIAVDRSTGPTRGNAYLLCSVTSTGNPVNVMFSRSTDGGSTWSAPIRINDDATNQGAYHWFGTLSVAPNGRIDACWNDTPEPQQHLFRALLHLVGRRRPDLYPIGRSVRHSTTRWAIQCNRRWDYIGMVSLNEGAHRLYRHLQRRRRHLFRARRIADRRLHHADG
jgi:hypothetical protein